MLPMKEESKFFSKMLTKESSMSNPSFRVYYNENSIAVPFVWEAKPGTPKHTKHGFAKEEDQNNEITLPPLTPPPSYYLKQPQKLPSNRSSNKKILGLFSKSTHRRQISSASSSSLSTPSSSSSSISVPDSTMRSSERNLNSSSSSSSSQRIRRRRSLSNIGSLFDFMGNDEENVDQDDVKTPRSVLCFGIVGSRRSIRSCSIADY